MINNDSDTSTFLDQDITIYSSVEIENEEDLPEQTETTQSEQVDQTKPMHHMDYGYSASFDNMDSASASNIDIGIQTDSLPKDGPRGH